MGVGGRDVGYSESRGSVCAAGPGLSIGAAGVYVIGYGSEGSDQQSWGE